MLEGLRPIIGQTDEIAWRNWHTLCQEFPGLSDRTTLRFVDRYAINVPVRPVDPPSIQWTYQRKPRIFWPKFRLIWLRPDMLFLDLDNPQHRWTYTLKVWRSPFDLVMPIAWRWLGRIARREDWYNRGTEMVPGEPPAPVVHTTYSYRTVQLRRYVWNMEWNDFIHPNYRIDKGEIACAYIPESDTLLVYRRER